MTPKQIESIRNKISKIKRALASDKKRHGGYFDDSRGLRYYPPELYLKLQDYKGALRYFNWFRKNFPDDVGYPSFLLEWSITLFKNGKHKEAEKMVLNTFFSKNDLIGRLADKEFWRPEIRDGTKWEDSTLVAEFIYHHSSLELKDFYQWLSGFVIGEKFYQYANEFIEIERRLKTEPVGDIRSQLVSRQYSILDDYN